MHIVGQSILEKFRLDESVALVTGAARGIGQSFAYTLGAAGARVAVADIDLSLAEKTALVLRESDVDAMAVEVDVSSKKMVEAMVEAVIDRWGTLTIAVNNAGVGGWADSENMTDDHWDTIMDVNLKGVLLCCQSEAKAMLLDGYGKIINIASVSAHVILRPQNQAAYDTSKAGVVHLTRSLAAEWASRGIRVNSISPGYTWTAMLRELAGTEQGSEMVPRWISWTPIGRLAEMDDLQGALLYLAAHASDYMTGQDLVLDGGYSLW